MRTVDELISKDASAIDRIRNWVAKAETECRILPLADKQSGDNRERALVAGQVATDLPLGAIAYETGGILVDSGWLRYLGCGHMDLPRNLADWNAGRADGVCLVADDVVGGFFAVNCGAHGDDADMYYWAPDSLKWEPIGFEFDFFFRWSLSSALGDFYQLLRWSNWASDIATALPTDHCFMFEPPLWTKQGSVDDGNRRTMPVADLFALKLAASVAQPE